MRDFITFQAPSETLDSYGQATVAWSNYLVNEPAKYAFVDGAESIRGTGGIVASSSGNFTKGIETQTAAVFTVRYRSGYNTRMRIVFNGKNYGITHIVDNYGSRYLEIHARSE